MARRAMEGKHNSTTVNRTTRAKALVGKKIGADRMLLSIGVPASGKRGRVPCRDCGEYVVSTYKSNWPGIWTEHNEKCCGPKKTDLWLSETATRR